MDNSSNWMVGWKHVQFSVQVNVGSLNPNASGVRICDLNIRMDLCDRHS